MLVYTLARQWRNKVSVLTLLASTYNSLFLFQSRMLSKLSRSLFSRIRKLSRPIQLIISELSGAILENFVNFIISPASSTSKYAIFLSWVFRPPKILSLEHKLQIYESTCYLARRVYKNDDKNVKNCPINCHARAIAPNFALGSALVTSLTSRPDAAAVLCISHRTSGRTSRERRSNRVERASERASRVEESADAPRGHRTMWMASINRINVISTSS